jgi:hypothetical protein
MGVESVKDIFYLITVVKKESQVARNCLTKYFLRLKFKNGII